jgi:BirA family transcriptional regulator, biotin operon repressor / biotin---[acetyl-CoA-carboxylase] ligase
MFNLQIIRDHLAPRPVRYFESIGSTNDEARNWLREGAPADAVVIADQQTKGRGRMGRVWQTPPGAALAVSVILHTPVEQLHQVSMIGALAISDVALGLGLSEVSIKWPNDVLVNGRKVSGVLPESHWDGDKLLGVVLGMGINVSVDFTGTELEDKAISLETAIGKALNRLDLLANLLTAVDQWQASPALFDTWKRRLVTLGQIVAVNTPNGTLHGLAETVDEHGVLILHNDQGELQRVIAGDIALV